ncbi:hypothetical protein C4D60_Mb01t03740 [Musa balbisiana]|uniref:Uncharacterized protein n=1 Tax=Musa balbisiana TaxID=52838 RepID=A0A4V4H733_MUSBA|nr:hypothetical protein C4D60_Mb01t03740 [Musa balbisiana]
MRRRSFHSTSVASSSSPPPRSSCKPTEVQLKGRYQGHKDGINDARSILCGRIIALHLYTQLPTQRTLALRPRIDQR